MASFHARIKEEKIRIVCSIDDENAPKPISSLDDLLQALGNSGEAKQQLVAERLPELTSVVAALLDTSLDASERIDGALEQLQSLTEEGVLQGELLAKAANLISLPSLGPTAKKLSEVFKVKGVEFHALSFSEWVARGQALLDLATENSRILLLIDEINEQEPQASLDGKQIIKRLSVGPTHKDSFVDCILVTNKCNKDQELAESQTVYDEVRMELRDEEPSAQARKIFVLAKDRLETRCAVLQNDFLIHLDRIEAARLGRNLAHASRSVLLEALDHAMEWIMAIPLPEFHGSIFLSSALEGASEADTLLRLVALKQELALERTMATSKQITDPIKKLRKIPSKHVMNSLPPSALADLRREEFERSGEHINKLLRPLACGDVFQFTVAQSDGKDKKTEVILLGNPCDLVIRSDGKRVSRFGLIAEIRRVKESPVKKGDANQLEYEIKTSEDEAAERYRIRLNRVNSVPLSVLDLVWTNSDGIARYSQNEAKRTYPDLQPSQQAYLNLLQAKVVNRDTTVDYFGTKIKSVSMSESNGEVEGAAAFVYPIRRTWRLTSTYAAAALRVFSQSLSRPTFGHDFLRFE